MCKLIIQVDSLSVVNAIRGERIGCASGWRLVQNIRAIKQKFSHFNIHHVYWEANSSADELAEYACSMEGDLVIFEQQPLFLSSLLRADVMGVQTPRLISVYFHIFFHIILENKIL